MDSRTIDVEVADGAIPIHVQGPEDGKGVPGLVVVPSIFGPAPDLLRQMSELAGEALTVVTDPFWRADGGVVPYDDVDSAFARLKGYDFDKCFSDTRAVIEWTRERCNGHVAGLGICFGGPPVIHAASEGALGGVITWHGSRMEAMAEQLGRIECPLRFHLGEADPITPPDVIEKLRAACANNSDANFVIYPGLEHGFSHEGRSYDAEAAQSGIDDTRALLAEL
jgi:carboxymethylenebutenolidase